MGTINDWGAIAAALLTAQCLLLNMAFVALAFGLWFGFRWLGGHALPAIHKVGGYLEKGRAAIDTGTAKIAAPVIKARGSAEGLRTAVTRLRKR